MPPVRRPRNQKQRKNENDITIRKERRIPLTEEMKIFLKKSPLILVPNLKLNIKDIPKTSVYDRKKKTAEQQKAGKANVEKIGAGDDAKSDCSNLESVSRVHATKSTIEGNQEPRPSSSLISYDSLNQMPKGSIQEKEKKTASPRKSESPSKLKDIRGDDSKKAAFLSALNLVHNTTAGRVKNFTEAEIPASILQKLTARRGQVSQFFRSQPLPVSSTLGRKIIRAGFGQCSNPADEVARYDKHCTPNKRNQVVMGNTVDWPVVNMKRSKLKPGQHCHKYSFGTRQRVNRQVELAVGVSAKSFPLLNKCKDFTIPVHKMTDLDVAQAMYQLQHVPPKEIGKIGLGNLSVPVRSWISSQPTAGPSRDKERIAEPVVLLHDIKYSSKYAKYLQ